MEEDAGGDIYWGCYWENIGCQEFTGDACAHTLLWWGTCDGTELNRDDFIASITWENYSECQALTPFTGSKEGERLKCS